MLKFLSEIKGSKITLFQEKALLSEVLDYLIDPENGCFLGVFVKDPFEKAYRIIPAEEIKGLGGDSIMVKGIDSLTPIEDIIKVQEALKINPKILGQKVVSEAGQFVGKIRDATIDFTAFKLDKLYVTPRIGIQSLSRELIIPASRILRIEKRKVVIKDEHGDVRSKLSVEAQFAQKSLP